MNIPIAEAQARLIELVRRAEAGEDVVLVDGGTTLRLQLLPQKTTSADLTPEQRRTRIEDIAERASTKASYGPDAEHSQDFLYDDFGLPA